MDQRPQQLQPAGRPDRASEAEWERLADETFAQRKNNIGRMPDRRRPATPTWYPPGTEPPDAA